MARRIAPEELGNMMVALTQLQNFIKSHNAQPIGPLVQAIKIGPAPEHAPELYMMQQATQLITQTEPGYEVDNASLWCARRRPASGHILFFASPITATVIGDQKQRRCALPFLCL